MIRKEDSEDMQIILFDCLIRVAAIERVLINNNIIKSEVLLKEIDTVSNEITKEMLKSTDLSKDTNLEEIIYKFKNRTN